MSLSLDPKFQSRNFLVGTAKPQRTANAGAATESTEDEYASWRQNNCASAESLDSMVEAMAKDEITPAEAFGISDAELAFAARLGAEQLELGQFENARKIFLGLTTAEPSVPHFHVSLGQVYSAMQRHEEAYEALSDGIELFARLPKEQLPGDLFIDAILLRGQTLVRLKRPEEATGDLNAVLAAFQDKVGNMTAENITLVQKLRQIEFMIQAVQGN